MRFQLKKKSLVGSFGLLALLVLVNASCYKGGRVEIPYELEPDAVLIHYIADAELNLYNDQPHALTLVIYQLTMPDLYYKYKSEKNGLEELLRLEVDDTSITGTNRIDIQPSDGKTVKFARYTGTKYVAIIAGYNTLENSQVSEIFKIPTGTQKRLFRKPSVTIEKLDIHLQFGPKQIDRIAATDKIRP
jgi:type VI secretion system VasD/TssJ family lipoprotein